MQIEETLQLAAETAGIGTWHLSLPESELSSSPKCKEVFGLSADAPFRYEDFLSVVHPDDRSLVEATVAPALDPQGTGSAIGRGTVFELSLDGGEERVSDRQEETKSY